MTTKTCGDCVFYNSKMTRNGCGMCTATTGRFKGLFVDPAMKACVRAYAEKDASITYGDRMRAMNNKEIAEYMYDIIRLLTDEVLHSKYEFIDIATQILDKPAGTDIVGEWYKEQEVKR